MELRLGTLGIIRPSSTVLAFLSLLIPNYTRTGDLLTSIERALPILFISMSTFIVNDLDDIEKDRINHPERPLPSGQVRPSSVAIFYFACLGAALVSVRYGVGVTSVAFLYYVLLMACVSYSYVVEFLPGVKPAYVAAAATIPLGILSAYFPSEANLLGLSGATFLFMLGREICKDLLDRAGDPSSWIHSVPESTLARAACVVQAIGLIILTLSQSTTVGLLAVLIVLPLLALSWWYWFTLKKRVTATLFMKLIVYAGLLCLI